MEDTHTVTYALKKLGKLGLVEGAKQGKEMFYRTTDKGRALCQEYADIRRECLIASFDNLNIDPDEIHRLAGMLRAMSGLYDRTLAPPPPCKRPALSPKFHAYRTPPLPEQLPDLGELPPLLQRLYAARGVTCAEELDKGLARLIPYKQLKGIDAAVELLVEALESASASCSSAISMPMALRPAPWVYLACVSWAPRMSIIWYPIASSTATA